ncbi:MAG: cell division topological specificity factor MinE [Gudongella sp.]|nr:cell division topological specificity factor MinE [Gudongella sp.]
MDFFKLFTKKQEKSKNVAKERLKLVLVHDRSDLSPRFLEMIKSDIVKVISKYAEIDESEIEIKMTKMKREGQNSPVSALVANIPIVNVKSKNK